MQFKDSQRYQASPIKEIWDGYIELGATKAAVSMLATTVLEDETFYHAYLDEYAQHYIYTDFAGQSFDAGWYVKVLHITEYSDGTLGFGSFKTDGSIGYGGTYKDKKNFQVALSKTKKQYGQPVVQEAEGARGYDYVDGWFRKYN